MSQLDENRKGFPLSLRAPRSIRMMSFFDYCHETREKAAVEIWRSQTKRDQAKILRWGASMYIYIYTLIIYIYIYIYVYVCMYVCMYVCIYIYIYIYIMLPNLPL